MVPSERFELSWNWLEASRLVLSSHEDIWSLRSDLNGWGISSTVYETVTFATQSHRHINGAHGRTCSDNSLLTKQSFYYWITRANWCNEWWVMSLAPIHFTFTHIYRPIFMHYTHRIVCILLQSIYEVNAKFKMYRKDYGFHLHLLSYTFYPLPERIGQGVL